MHEFLFFPHPIALVCCTSWFNGDLMSFPFFMTFTDVRYFNCKQKLRWRGPRFHIRARGRSGGSIRDRRNIRWWAKCKVSVRPPWLFIKLLSLLFCYSLIDSEMFSFKIYHVRTKTRKASYWLIYFWYINDVLLKWLSV